MVSSARRNAAAPPSMRAIRAQRVSQSDMTQLDLRRSICDALNPITDSEKERERERKAREVRNSIKAQVDKIQIFFYYS